MVVRAIEELVSVEDPGWPEVESLVGASAEGQVLLGDSDRSRDVLFALQVTSRSFLGAMALNCGGVVADHGWFRLLGGAGSSLMDLASADSLSVPASDSGPPPLLIVGFDALGGRFAVDGGGHGVNTGEVCYFGPDSLEWSGLGGGHTAFLRAALGADLSDVFASLRWLGWEDEAASLPLDQGLSPPPFALGGQDLSHVSRRPVPTWSPVTPTR